MGFRLGVLDESDLGLEPKLQLAPPTELELWNEQKLKSKSALTQQVMTQVQVAELMWKQEVSEDWGCLETVRLVCYQYRPGS